MADRTPRGTPNRLASEDLLKTGVDAPGRVPRTLSDGDFAMFQSLVHDVAGIYLAPNKRALLTSQLTRRLDALGLLTYRAYYDHLRVADSKGDEREHFINAITINKTDFFREVHHFDFLRQRVIPELRARVAAGAPRRLRIWSAACSSGEEPYSIAMVAHRELAHDGYLIEIVASDIDTAILARAEAGRYRASQVEPVPSKYRSRYLKPDGALWRVSDELRPLVHLHQVNLVGGAFPFQGTFDAIFIRNVIIYFDRVGQTQLFQRLRGYLADTSYLFLGHSESLQYMDDTFTPAGCTIYRPATAVRSQPPRLRRTTAVTRLDSGGVLASQHPVRIDAVVGPCVNACVYDPEAKVGGMVQFDTAGTGSAPAAAQIAQLIAELEQLGALRERLQAKLVGGGGTTSDDREDGARDVGLAVSELEHAGISIASKRVGGEGCLEIQFFTSSGRLLCRAAHGTQ
jgi:chemotaxis protein methyltransferase CheR